VAVNIAVVRGVTALQISTVVSEKPAAHPFRVDFTCPEAGRSTVRTYEEICALLGYYAAYSGKSLPTFRDNISVPSSGVKNSRRSRLQEFLDFWPL